MNKGINPKEEIFCINMILPIVETLMVDISINHPHQIVGQKTYALLNNLREELLAGLNALKQPTE